MMKRAFVNPEEYAEPRHFDWGFLFYWIGATLIGGLVGLGAVIVAYRLVSADSWRRIEAAGAIVPAVLALVSAVGFAVVVGYFQTKVLRAKFIWFGTRRWMTATACGSAAAGLLGILCLRVLGSAADPGRAPLGAMDALVVAALIGGVLGAIVAVPQWLVLKRMIPRAGWWILACSISFALAAPQLSEALLTISRPFILQQDTLFFLAATVGAGVTVGAVSGLFLTWLARGL